MWSQYVKTLEHTGCMTPILALVFLVADAGPAHAYLDPGTGGMLGLVIRYAEK